ncbi:hypothetical protein RRG08_019398 [Elysia crispata]|uniref:Uncharacterized protein n=1 Tax=Elysia crispata TaxID=231223 RepID=A0AAE1DLL8_9GAST|nr:hypothetical protein RRG08_019398 [Elysia crispata]
MSSLSDSAAYMRGINNGYETKLQDDAPHLLNIDGDICHHIHNITKQFSSQLDPENHLPHLLDDIHKDLEFSANIKDDFFNICKILGVQEKQPKERVGHRWMSLYDSSKVFEEICDPLTLLYFSWLSAADKTLYQDSVFDIYKRHKVTAAGKQNIISIMRKLKAKNMTMLGRKRKERVCKKLFDKRRETDLLYNCILSIFPCFKAFVLAFETKKPMLHKLYDNIVTLFKNFLKWFVMAQDLRETGKKLASLDLTDSSKFILVDHIYTGECATILSSMPKEDSLEFKERLMTAYKTASMPKEDSLEFKERLMTAYKTTAVYMQKKMPLDNKLLTTLSLLDPLAFGQTETAILLKKLPSFFPSVSAPSF